MGYQKIVVPADGDKKKKQTYHSMYQIIQLFLLLRVMVLV